MIHALSMAGLAALRLLPAQSLVGLDFDGTLAPITTCPKRSGMAPQMARVFTSLVLLSRVAVISGRQIADLAPRLPVAPGYLLGNHGVEGLPGQEALCLQAAQFAAQWRARLRPLEDSHPGVRVEDKLLSISVHYRLARDRRAALAAIDRVLDGLQPAPRTIGGHCVVNLVHPLAPDKGGAFDALVRIAGCGSAVYVGDDETDETVFRQAPGHWFTVRVGFHPGTAARYFLYEQSEVQVLLRRLTRHFAGLARAEGVHAVHDEDAADGANGSDGANGVRGQHG